jgi:hypothetical protein
LTAGDFHPIRLTALSAVPNTKKLHRTKRDYFGAKKHQLNDECRTGNIEYRSVDVFFKIIKYLLSTFDIPCSTLS